MKEYTVKIQMRDSAGLVLTEVVKKALAAEIVLLQHIHGTNSVIHVSGPISRSLNRKEMYDRLVETYGARLVQRVIGPSGAGLPNDATVVGADEVDGEVEDEDEIAAVEEAPRRGRGRPPRTEQAVEDAAAVFS